MDLAFPSFDALPTEARASPPLDHDLLLAALAAQRSALMPDGRLPGASPTDRPALDDALTVLLLGDSGWREAARAQGGCFSRAEAGRRIKVW